MSASVSFSYLKFLSFYGADNQMVVSPNLLAGNPGHIWMNRSFETHILIGGLLGVLQPELYDVGKSGIFTFIDNPALVTNPNDLREALACWNVPFDNISIIAQGQTPLHRDISGRKEWMEILVALGKYDHGRFGLPDLNVTLKYNPGCVIALSRMLLQHGADCSGGERACIAFYMCDAVHARLGLPVVGYANIDTFQK